MTNLDPSKSAALRKLITTIDAEVAGLLSQETDKSILEGVTRLHVAWVNVVTLLNLGPEPDVTCCPSCNQVVRIEATRCGYCWVSLQNTQGEG